MRGGRTLMDTLKSSGKPKNSGNNQRQQVTASQISTSVPGISAATSDRMRAIQEAQMEGAKKAAAMLAAEHIQSGDGNSCLVCSEELHESICVFECGHHIICGMCCARLRIIDKNRKCPICKKENDHPICLSADAYNEREDVSYDSFGVFGDMAGPGLNLDNGSGIFFHSSCAALHRKVVEIREFTCNCPLDKKGGLCKQTFATLAQLTKHMESHQMRLCDYCAKNRAVFPMELPRMTKAEYEKHCNVGDAKTGFLGHPQCELCPERFYDSSGLFAHRERDHFKCHICQRNRDADEPETHRYFKEYEDLEKHFIRDHFICKHPSCVGEKFQVFGNSVELKIHMAERHGEAYNLASEFAFDFGSHSNASSSSSRRGGVRGSNERTDRSFTASAGNNSREVVITATNPNMIIPEGVTSTPTTSTPSPAPSRNLNINLVDSSPIPEVVSRSGPSWASGVSGTHARNAESTERNAALQRLLTSTSRSQQVSSVIEERAKATFGSRSNHREFNSIDYILQSAGQSHLARNSNTKKDNSSPNLAASLGLDASSTPSSTSSAGGTSSSGQSAAVGTKDWTLKGNSSRDLNDPDDLSAFLGGINVRQAKSKKKAASSFAAGSGGASETGDVTEAELKRIHELEQEEKRKEEEKKKETEKHITPAMAHAPNPLQNQSSLSRVRSVLVEKRDFSEFEDLCKTYKSLKIPVNTFHQSLAALFRRVKASSESKGKSKKGSIEAVPEQEDPLIVFRDAVPKLISAMQNSTLINDFMTVHASWTQDFNEMSDLLEEPVSKKSPSLKSPELTSNSDNSVGVSRGSWASSNTSASPAASASDAHSGNRSKSESGISANMLTAPAAPITIRYSAAAEKAKPLKRNQNDLTAMYSLNSSSTPTPVAANSVVREFSKNSFYYNDPEANDRIPHLNEEVNRPAVEASILGLAKRNEREAQQLRKQKEMKKINEKISKIENSNGVATDDDDYSAFSKLKAKGKSKDTDKKRGKDETFVRTFIDHSTNTRVSEEELRRQQQQQQQQELDLPDPHSNSNSSTNNNQKPKAKIDLVNPIELRIQSSNSYEERRRLRRELQSPVTRTSEGLQALFSDLIQTAPTNNGFDEDPEEPYNPSKRK